MEQKWNEALAAFDREVLVIRALDAEYEGFVSYVVKEVARRVARASGEAYRSELEEGEETGQWVAKWTDDDAVEIKVWPSAPWGGPSGLFRVGLFIDGSLCNDEDMPDEIAEVVQAVRESVSELTGEMGSSVHDIDLRFIDDDEDESEAVCIKVASVPASASNLVDQLSSLAGAYTGASARAVEAVASIRGGSAYTWMRRTLKDLLASGDLRNEIGAEGLWTSKTLRQLGSGAENRFIELGAKGVERMMVVTTAPGGKMTFHLGRRCDEKHASQVCEALNVPPSELDGYHGGVVMDETEVEAAFREDEPTQIRAKVLATWRAHVEAQGQ